ncbi:MAG: transglycosylase SLT domain-containing protein [Flavobacteriales bacterium]|nr:transglycosylase SLT domain-containing protein [Flavobacteriales bacterium]
MQRLFYTLFIAFLPLFLCAFYPINGSVKVEVTEANADQCMVMVQENSIYTERWDTLAQPVFWRTVMNLGKDSGVINIGSTRQILKTISIAKWNEQTPEQKQAFRDSVKKYYHLPADEHIYMTSGKSHFYHFEDVLPAIDKAIQIFEADSTDPFYAQAILLIESPGKPKKSPVGAYGSFQLMKGVAIAMGLTVNNTVDDRKDFDKCAHGAAKLLRTVCIPEANKTLAANNIDYSEDNLWYKLLVLHVYHAGAYNVGKAIRCIPEDVRCGNDIITELWKVECGSFRNASQNYSQVALASLIELESIVYSNCENIEPLAYN